MHLFASLCLHAKPHTCCVRYALVACSDAPLKSVRFGVQGAWGFWYLPGSPSFHTNWTGVAEISGGLGCILGALKLPMLPSWMLPVSAACMFLLTVVIFPANVLMWTHNAPLPLDSMQPAYEAGDRKGIAGLPYHIPRAILQAVFLATWLGLAMAHA